MVFVYFIQWSSFCSTLSKPKPQYMAVISPFQMRTILPGKKIPGPGGVTLGYIDKVWTILVELELFNQVNKYLTSTRLDLAVMLGSLCLIEDTGVVYTSPNRIPEIIPNELYPLEVHKLI